MITEEQIIEGNKMIAEFMDAKYHPFADLVYMKGLPMKSLAELEFHTSWDWLMPVVEKINETTFEKYQGELGFLISPGLCDVYNDGDEIIIMGESQETFILCVWHTVIQFLKWYNQLPLPEKDNEEESDWGHTYNSGGLQS